MTQRRGFSVIEVLIAAAVFSVLIFVVASLRTNVDTLSNLVSQKLQSRQDIDRAMEQMVTEIRSAAPSSQGAYPIDEATTSTLVFYSDVDSDGLFERIRYTVGTTTLDRGVTKPSGTPLAYATSSETVSTLVSSLTRTTSSNVFTYYGEDYTGTEDPLPATSTLPSAVRLVRVTLYVDVRPREAPRPAYVSQLINIRNLRDD
jgi:prepilin-type N-terminal cleavage/methylation domain-containing protein